VENENVIENDVATVVVAVMSTVTRAGSHRLKNPSSAQTAGQTRRPKHVQPEGGGKFLDVRIEPTAPG